MPTDTLRPPLVTVVMAVRDGERYLREAMDSLVRQSMRDFEVAVVDDGSIDATAGILQAYAEADDRVHVLTQPCSGLVRSLNHACARVSSPYIARMDADDVCIEDRLARQVAFLDQHPSVGVVGGAVILTHAAGATLELVRYPTSDAELRRVLDRGQSPFVHPAVMMRSAVFHAAGGYRERFEYAQDYDLWLRIAGIAELANLPEPVLRYRYHADQRSTERLREQTLSVLAARTAARSAQGPDADEAPAASVEALLAAGVPRQEIQGFLAHAYVSAARRHARLGSSALALHQLDKLMQSAERPTDRATLLDVYLQYAAIYRRRRSVHAWAAALLRAARADPPLFAKHLLGRVAILRRGARAARLLARKGP